jgi:hypothetical protein
LLKVDCREKDIELRAAADEICLLEYENPAGGGKFSYDIEVHTAGGKVLRGERKALPDFIASWRAGKLERQASAVDFLLVEWDWGGQAFADAEDAGNAYKHLLRMALAMPVLVTTGVDHTVATLRYLERHWELSTFGNSIRVKAPTLRERMVRSLSPSISPDTFAAIWANVDRTALIHAMRVEQWPINPTVRKRILKDLMQP